MPKQIRTPEPNTRLCYQGEHYESDEDCLVTMPDVAAEHFIESHGCVDPTQQHPHGLKIKAVGKGDFVVVDGSGVQIHSGVLDQGGASALARC